MSDPRDETRVTPRCLLPWASLAALPVLAAVALLGLLLNLWRD